MAGKEIVLSIIIVNWNGGNAVLDCLDSIFQHSPAVNFEVIVWDNASTDESAKMIGEKYHQVKLLQSDKNLGFGKGNNRASKIARGEYLLFLNNDTVVKENSIDYLLNGALTEDNVGVWGCKILKPNGALQYSAGRFSNFLTEFLEQTMLHRVIEYGKYRASDYLKNFEPDWVTGACMLVRKQIYDEIGGFDEDYFMFFEDMDLCKKTILKGLKVKFVPEAVVIHKKGYSSKSVINRMLVEDQKSTYRFIRKYYPKWHLFIYRLLASLGSLIRIVYWAILGLIGNEEDALLYINGYAKILVRTWFDDKFVYGGDAH